MATKEFYIRNADETDARGPFTLEQITSLAEAGQVTPDTLYYEALAEQWVVIKDNEEVKDLIFPEKKKLSIKKDAKIQNLNKANEDDAPIEVTDFLAAAEGKTEDTKDKSEHIVMADRCAKIGIWGCIATLLVAASGEILPSIDVLTQFTAIKLLHNPLVALGVLDLVLSILLGLGVISLYPFVRFRAMLGMGFLGFVFYSQGQPLLLLAAVAGSLGLYTCTFVLSYGAIGISLLLSLGGMGALAFLLIR